MPDTIASLSELYWDVWIESSPLAATIYGDHRFDDQLGPTTHEESAEVASKLRDIGDRVRALGPLDRADALTRDILIVTVKGLVGLIDSGIYSAAISPFLGVQTVLPSGLSRNTAAEPEHAEMLLERVRSIPAYLTKVEQRQRIDLASGLTPTGTNLERVLGQLDALVKAPIESDPMMAIGTPPGWAGEAEWRENLRHAVLEGVRPAFARHREFLADTAGPVARSDDQPGLLHLPDGQKRYETLIEVFTSLDLGADEIHRIGMEEATGVLRDEFATIGQEAFGISDPAEVITQLRDDPDLRYDTAEEMLQHSRATIERAWAAVPEWFGVMPKGPCVVEPVPDALAPAMPGAYYGVAHPTGPGQGPTT